MSAPFTSYPYLPVWSPHSSLTAKLLYGLMLDRLSLSMKNGWFDDQNSKTLKSILVSCGARLAPFDIQEVRDITMYDELELDMLGDRKTALFLIMSDTDATFNFLVAMMKRWLSGGCLRCMRMECPRWRLQGSSVR